MDLIAVVMKAPTSAIRFKDASSLLDYGFANFEYKTLVSKNNIIQNVKISKGILPTINAIASNDCGTIIAKGQDVNIEATITLPDSLSAPVLHGDVIGKISFTLNGEILAESDLIASETVNKINLVTMNSLVLNNWINLLR